jgi:hypothetical protein
MMKRPGALWLGDELGRLSPWVQGVVMVKSHAAVVTPCGLKHNRLERRCDGRVRPVLEERRRAVECC